MNDKLVPARLPDNEGRPPDYLVNGRMGRPAVLHTDPEPDELLSGMQRIPKDGHVRVYDIGTRNPAGVWCPASQKVEQPYVANGRPIHSKGGRQRLLCPHSDKNELVQ